MSKYSVVIPVYHGELTIGPLVMRLKDFFIQQAFDYEIIIVYDCGPDNSWAKIEELKNQLGDKVKAVRLSRNYGQHNALICGFKYATGDFIITMDEDLQHKPEDIIKLVEKQREGNYDLVYGKYEELKHNNYRNLTSTMLKKMLQISIPDLHEDYTAFRLIKARIAKETLVMNNSYTFLDGYLSWVTTNAVSVEVSHSERFAGQSSYTFKKLFAHAINIFVTFSLLPIRLLTYSSFIIFILCLFYAVYLVVRKLFFNDLISGYASTMIVLGLGFGIVLFGLGIIGEYIHRINLKTTRKPNFVESEVL